MPKILTFGPFKIWFFKCTPKNFHMHTTQHPLSTMRELDDVGIRPRNREIICLYNPTTKDAIWAMIRMTIDYGRPGHDYLCKILCWEGTRVTHAEFERAQTVLPWDDLPPGTPRWLKQLSAYDHVIFNANQIIGGTDAHDTANQ